MACANAYDTITQSDGIALSNEYAITADRSTSLMDDAIVSSFSRTADGTWIAWFQSDSGDGIDFGPVQEKTEWPGLVASSAPIGIGFFPDDGSAPVTYRLGLEWPAFTWKAGTYSSADRCSYLGGGHHPFANDQQSIMTSWFVDIIDLQVKTDGSNVWLVALARETVSYPYITNKLDADRCGVVHIGIEQVLEIEGGELLTGYAGDVFIHDTDTGTRWWQHFGGPDSYNDDAGINNSFRWNPARVTVWCGDTGGFTRLGTRNAVTNNDIQSAFGTPEFAGKISCVEVAASAAEPGVAHVMWSEGGIAGTHGIAGYVERIDYSRWDTAGEITNAQLTGGFTSDFILRNDHGSGVAIIGTSNAATAGVIGELVVLDLDSLSALQTLTPDLFPTNDEAGGAEPFFQVGNPSSFAGSPEFGRRRMFASSLYTDPRRENTDVYLLSVPFTSPDGAQCTCFYRIPCDGSDAFEYLDGMRLPGYSIVQGFHGSSGLSLFNADFVSDPENIWVPSTEAAPSFALGGVMHLDRQCLRGWEALSAFPIGDPSFGFATADWQTQSNNANPPSILSLDGGDWLVGGGVQIPAGTDPSLEPRPPVEVAAIRAKICRCCLPCNRTGMHVWEII